MTDNGTVEFSVYMKDYPNIKSSISIEFKNENISNNEDQEENQSGDNDESEEYTPIPFQFYEYLPSKAPPSI